MRLVLFAVISVVVMHQLSGHLTEAIPEWRMEEHRREWINRLLSNQDNINDSSYQLQRAIRTISGKDCDKIPKVEDAGKIIDLSDGLSYQVMHNGVKVLKNGYYDAPWITDVICGLKGHHEPQEEKCFYEILKHIPDGAVMIELGAYWAYYSLWFAYEISDAINYMIEPDPKRLNVGRRNFILNNKTGSFHRGYLGTVIDTDPDLAGARKISIDDFIEEQNIEHVHILHSDIQGSEASMLETCVRHLDHIDYFVISTHDHVSAHLKTLEFFKKHGLIIVAEHTLEESFSGDGLVVAKRKGVKGPDSVTIAKYGK